jgi:hypothetical protein
LPSHTNSFPLVYCNGDSYSNNNYHESLLRSTYDFTVAKEFNGFNINNSISGSCNRRIIRTSVADLTEQRKINPSQRIIALIGLTFDLRDEFWNDDFLRKSAYQENDSSSVYESDFLSFQFSGMGDWFERIRQGKIIKPLPTNIGKNFTKKFFNVLNNARAFFFSPYADKIDLYCDLVMFKALMDSMDIEFLVFNAPPTMPLESEATLDHFSQQIEDDERFIGFSTNFSFCEYLSSNNFVPLDSPDNPVIGHYGSEGHSYFAKNVLLPLLNKA